MLARAALTAIEETDGVEIAYGGDLEIFGIKSETTWGGLLFIGSKLSEAVLKLEPPLMILEFINSGSVLKLLLMKVLSVAVQDLNHC
jgi:hypothetical protein